VHLTERFQPFGRCRLRARRWRPRRFDGGIFMSAKDPKALCDWYRKRLGIDVHVMDPEDDKVELWQPPQGQ